MHRRKHEFSVRSKVVAGPLERLRTSSPSRSIDTLTMSASFGSVITGIAGGLAASTALFYTITVSQIFGGTTPIDQNTQWQTKTEDLQLDGKWEREAGPPVHMNPIRNKISGTAYALNLLKSVEDDAEDDAGDDEE